MVSSLEQHVTHLFCTTHFPLYAFFQHSLVPHNFLSPPKKVFRSSLSIHIILALSHNTTQWFHSPAVGRFVSLFSPTSPLHPLPFPPPTPPAVMNQFLQRFLCSLCRQPDSFRGRTDGPDTCCRLVRPRNKSLSWQRRLGQ